ncbi:hypothetical protein HAX54_006756 [Datura stramonium]|uniref:Uncharacterized protein n=1 Tax=Datura stramonium TaxID=4076 RepID=A0ABS8TDA5_DATST|nr:hypothetical protein [Datura stramonium]
MLQQVEEQPSEGVSGRRCAVCAATHPFILQAPSPLQSHANNVIEINLHLAKQLVAAATIAFESIHNAAVMARINADIRPRKLCQLKPKASFG